MKTEDIARFGQIFKRLLIFAKKGLIEEFVGCTDEQIRKLMEIQKVDYLPTVYVSFMRELGINAAQYSRQNDCAFADVIQFKVILDNREPDEKAEIAAAMPTDAFIFHNSGGYAYFYFCTKNQDPNPPVFILDADKNLEESYNRGQITWLVAETLMDFYLSDYVRTSWYSKYYQEIWS